MSNFQKLFEKIPSEYDAVLITSDINRRYFTGMKSSAGIVLAFREKSYLLIDFRYFEKAFDAVKGSEVILLKNTYEQLKELLKKHGAKRILVETHSMTLQEFSSYQKALDEFELCNDEILSNEIDNIRSVKTEDEIEKIKKAQNIAEKAFENVLNFIRVGRTEKEIAFALDSYMLQNGAEALSFETIALTGAETSLPHGVPSERTAQNGNFVLMDFGAVYDGYHSDMTRTICLGTLTEKMHEVYNIVLEAQKRALNYAKAGIKGSLLDKIARDYITENGYGPNFGHSLGHGVGMEIHEYPNASPKSETVLKENMVITIEPGIYIPQKFGVRIEDFIVIKSDGNYNMTNSDKNLIVL